MAAKLDRKDGVLKITLKGMDQLAFQDALLKVKSIPGRRWNKEEKVWEVEDSPDMMMRIVYSIHPELTAETRALVNQAQAKVADDLVNKMADDAALVTPWADDLYPFQRSCIEFATYNEKALITDDMGLGKTIEAISTVYEHWHRNGGAPIDRPDVIVPTLIVAGNSNLGKWKSEYSKWLDLDGVSLLPHVQHGGPMEPVMLDGKTKRKRQAQIDEAMTTSGILVVNWEKLRLADVAGPTEWKQRKGSSKKSGIGPWGPLTEIDWYGVIADECHRATNRDSQQAMSLQRLRGKVMLGLTGTPIQTSPDNLWSILHWLDPERYSSFWRFFNDYTDAYQGFKGYVVIGVKNPEALRFELKDKLVRRTKPQVGIQLPPSTHSFVNVDMHPKQAKLYAEAEKAFMLELSTAAEEGKIDFEKLDKAFEEGRVDSAIRMIPNGAARFGLMRQIAVSPALVGEEDNSGLMNAAVEMITDHPGKQFVVWGYHKLTVELMAHRLRKQKPQIIAEYIHGDVDPRVRDEYVERFQQGNIQVLCCSLKTMNEGVDLFAADTDIFLERATVAVANEQAEARIDRIGQVHPTTHVVLGSNDTVQTGRIADLNRIRELIAAAVLGKAPR